MKFEIRINSGLYPENQYSKKLFEEGAIRPEMDCFDYNVIEAYFQDLVKDIKVDNSINDWTLFVDIYLGGAMNRKEIAIGKRGITYINTNEKAVSIRISLPTKEEIDWGITKKHRFNEYAKRNNDNGFTIIPVDYNQFENMTDYIESSIKLALMRMFIDGISLKKQKIKI